MYLKVDEEIDTLALFEGNLIRPLRFRWKGTVYHIKEITSQWQSRSGILRLRHFTALDTSTNCYHLLFNPHNCRWRLSKIWQD